MMTALMAGVVIPWGGALDINGTQYQLQIADLNIGILYIFGVVSIGVYGIMIGGWASNNKFSLIGAIRASAQMISYELAMGLSIIALVMVTGTLSLREITLMQGGGDGQRLEHVEHRVSARGFHDLHHLRLRRMQPHALRPPGN